MSARPFSPVWLTLPGISTRRIDSAFEALECLTADWPDINGRCHRRAVQACRDALDGFVSPDVARRAFLEAARTVAATVDRAPPANAVHLANIGIQPRAGSAYTLSNGGNDE